MEISLFQVSYAVREPSFFYTVAYGRVRAQAQSGGSLFIGGKKLRNFEILGVYTIQPRCQENILFINPRRACARVTVLVNTWRACARDTVLVNPRRACAARVTVVLCVCMCVCMCVCPLIPAASRNQAYKQQYQRLQRDTGMKYKKGFFFKTLRSEVMASFTHLE